MTEDAHETAMAIASEAELLALEGRQEAGRQKLERAAQLEERAADAATMERPRTRGILRISAVSLWLQAGHPGRAAELATRYLDEPLPPDFARELDELRTICQHEQRAARALPAVDAGFLERARERELAFARGEIASGRIANPRAA